MQDAVGYEVEEEEDVEVEDVETVSSGVALEAVERATIDTQIETAKRWPRSIEQFKRDAMTLATLDEETAASMFYAIPRGGKQIEGPSARLAEVVASTWGNIRADADIVAEERDYVTAMGTCLDLQRNVGIRVRVRRRIVNKHGERYSSDMIGVTSNAAISIALRNAVFKVVPFALVKPIYEAARKASLGEGGTIEQKRRAALDWFAKLGVEEERIYAVLDVKGRSDIGEDELITLRGLVTAIKDGDTTVEQVFPRPGSTDTKTDQLNEELRERRERSEGADSGPAPTDDDGAEPSDTEPTEGSGAHPPEGSAADDEEPMWGLDEPAPTLEALEARLPVIDSSEDLDLMMAVEQRGPDRVGAVRMINERRSEVDA